MTAPSTLAKQPEKSTRATPGGAARIVRGILRAPLAMLADPLVRNGYALVASAALTSILGVVFWILAARLYTEQQVGVGAALISTLLTLGNAAQLNLGNLLNRFVPEAGARAGALILSTYSIAAALAVVASIGFLFVAENFVAPLAFLTDSVWTSAWFVVATVAWTVFALQDSALAGLRQAVWVLAENAVYAVAKIALLVLFAHGVLAYLGPYGAWTFPLVVFVAFINLVIFRRLLPARRTLPMPARLPDPRRMARFLGWDYLGSLAMGIAMGAAPLLIVNVVGAAANASYHIAWTIAYSLYLVGRSMDISLLTEGSTDQRRLPSLAADALLQTMMLVCAGVALVVLGAPLIMALFGPSYAEDGTSILRILALSTIPWSFITIHLSVVRARGHTAVVAAVQVATLLILLAVGFALLHQMGALGMAVAWLVAHSTVAIGTAVIAMRNNGSTQAGGWLINLASAAARLNTNLGLRQPKTTAVADPEQSIREALHAAGEPEAMTARPLHSVVSQSDSLTVYLSETARSGPRATVRPNRAHLLFKKASSPEGVASVERTLARLADLRSDPRVADCGFQIPEILTVSRAADGIRVIEKKIPGEDGRATIRRPFERDAALAAGVQAIANLHARTSEPAVIGERWLSDWIDGPANQLKSLPGTLLTATRRLEAIAAFLGEQHDFWRGQTVALGWGHGDFSPGNIIFTAPADDSRSGGQESGLPTVTVSGVVDWDRARADTPAGFDPCYLAVSTLALTRGEQIGQTVRTLLHEPRGEPTDEAWLGASAGSSGPAGWPGHPAAIRAMVGLVWLHHVAANVEKSRRYSASRFWTAVNVDWVLREFARLKRPPST